MNQNKWAVWVLVLFTFITVTACSKPPGLQGSSVPSNQGHGDAPQKSTPAALDADDFVVRDIRRRMPIEEVKQKLGNPTHADYVKGIGADVLMYEQLGLFVYFNRMTGLVTGWSIQETSGLQTKRRIGIGATKEEVLAAYGTNTTSDSDATQLFYASSANPGSVLGFEIIEGKVRRIAVGGDQFLW